MPYTDVKKEKVYLKRNQVFIDAFTDKSEEGSQDPFEYSVRLREPIRDVVGMELKNWGLPSSLSPTFYGQWRTRQAGISDVNPNTTDADLTHKDLIPANNEIGNVIFDFQLLEEDGVTVVHDIPVNMELAALKDVLQQTTIFTLADGILLDSAYTATNLHLSPWKFVQALREALLFTFISMGTEHEVNYTNTILHLRYGRVQRVSTNLNDPSRFFMYPASSVRRFKLALLFKSGPNAGRHVGTEKMLGFEPGVDAVALDVQQDPEVYVDDFVNYIQNGSLVETTFLKKYLTVAPNTIDSMPFKFIDVKVKEVPELDPLARIFLERPNFSETRTLTLPRTVPLNDYHGMRFLDQPIKNLRKVSLKLVLEGGRKLKACFDPKHFFVLEILSLSRESSVPDFAEGAIVI
jgi:hypothetical protein